MATIQVTHLTGEPLDLAAFLNSWEAPIGKPQSENEKTTTSIQQQGCGEDCKCKSKTVDEVPNSTIVEDVAEDKPSADIISTEKPSLDTTSTEKPKRTRKPKADKIEVEPQIETLQTVDAKDFIESEKTVDEEQSTEEQSTEAEVKEKAIEDAFAEVPKTVEVTEEQSTEEQSTEEQSTEAVTLTTSFEVMFESAKLWGARLKQSGVEKPHEYITALFKYFGGSETGKSADVDPAKYAFVYNKIQAPETVNEIKEMLEAETSI